MSSDENKELWEFMGAVKARLDNGDKQFDETKEMLVELKDNVTGYHKKLDKHLTLHKYINRIVVGIGSVVAAVWRSV